MDDYRIKRLAHIQQISNKVRAVLINETLPISITQNKLSVLTGLESNDIANIMIRFRLIGYIDYVFIGDEYHIAKMSFE